MPARGGNWRGYDVSKHTRLLYAMLALLAVASRAAGTEAATELWEEAWGPAGSDRSLPRRAKAYEAAGHQAAAAKLYRRMAQLAELDENKAACLVQRAKCLLGADRHYAAWQCFEEAASSYPLHVPYDEVVESLREIAVAFMRGEASMFGWKKPGLAAEVYELILELSPVGEHSAEDSLTLVKLMRENGDVDEAIVRCQELVRRHPDVTEARLELGKMLLTLAKGGDGDGRIKREASQHLERFLEATPDHSRAEEAELLLTMTREQQAQNQLRLGRFYSHPAHYRPTVARRYLHDVLREYPSTSAASIARALLAELDAATFEQARRDAQSSKPEPTPSSPAPTRSPPDATTTTQPPPPTPKTQISTVPPTPGPGERRSMKKREQVTKWLLPLEDLSKGADEDE